MNPSGSHAPSNSSQQPNPNLIFDLAKQNKQTPQVVALNQVHSWLANAVPELHQLQKGLNLLDQPNAPVGLAPLPPQVQQPDPSNQQGTAMLNAIRHATSQGGNNVLRPGSNMLASGYDADVHHKNNTRAISLPNKIDSDMTNNSNNTIVSMPINTIPTTIARTDTLTATGPAPTEVPVSALSSMIEHVLCTNLSTNAKRVAKMDSTELTKLALSAPDEVVPALEELQKRRDELSALIRKFHVESGRRVKRATEPPRAKIHWDYLLQEMEWLGTDFQRERRWKMLMARKLAKAAVAYHERRASAAIRVQKEGEIHTKKVAAHVSRMVKQFWIHINKLVIYKRNLTEDAKRKAEMDLHLEQVVAQTEHLSASIALDLKRGAGTARTLKSNALKKKKANAAVPVSTNTPAATTPATTPMKSTRAKRGAADSKRVDIAVIEEESEDSVEEDGEIMDDAGAAEEMTPFDPSEIKKEDAKLVGGASTSESRAITSILLSSGTMSSPGKRRSTRTRVPVKVSKNKRRKLENMKDDENDAEFDEEEEEDDETTLDKEEELGGEGTDVNDEIAKLEAAMDVPIEELLAQYYGNLEADEDEDDEDEEEVVERTEDAVTTLPAATTASEEVDAEDGDDTEDDEDVEDEDDEPSVHALGREEGEAKMQSNMNIASTFQPVGSTFDTQKVRTPVPSLLHAQLREYQHIGLDWLVSMYENGLNGILADEMGLGKTVQTISWLAWLACEKGIWGQHLVIVPTSVMINWEMEFKRFAPGLKVICYFGSVKERAQKRVGWSDPNSFHVCITSYQLVLQDARVFKRKQWHCMILDEAHNIKNFKSKRWRSMLNFRAERRLLLTGTPLQNSMMELWALMHFLMPDIFESQSEFRDWFSEPVTQMIEGKEQVNHILISRLHGVLRPFILRRLKKDVAKQLPDKHEHVIKCKMSKRQRVLYDEFMNLGDTQRTLNSGNFLGMMSVLLQLRKVCNHPDLFAGRVIASPLAAPTLELCVPSQTMVINSHDINATLKSGLLGISCGRIWDENPEMVQAIAGFANYTAMLFTQSGLKTYPAPYQRVPFYGVISPNLDNTANVTGVEAEPVSNRGIVPVYNGVYGGNADVPPLFYQIPEEEKNNSHGRAHLSLIQVLGDDGSVTLGSEFAADQSISNFWRDVSSAQKSNFTENRTRDQLISSLRSWSSDAIMPVCVYNTLSSICLPHDLANLHSRCNEFSPYNYKNLSPNIHQETLPNNTVNANAARQGFLFTSHSSNTYAVLEGGNKHIYPDSEESYNAWLRTPNALLDMVQPTARRMKDAFSVINAFVFLTPRVLAKAPQLVLSNYSPGVTREIELRSTVLKKSLDYSDDVLYDAKVRQSLYFPDKRLIEWDCGKLQRLAVLLSELRTNGHRTLIFTQFSKMLDIQEVFLNLHGYTYLRLDGSTKVEDRARLMEKFNTNNKIFCFILSTRAGGVGVNLTGADSVVFYDSDWNPAIDQQAQDRCHRIGQTREVNIYRLITENSVEENILRKSNQKRQMNAVVIGDGEFTTDFLDKLDPRELLGLKEFNDPSNTDTKAVSNQGVSINLLETIEDEEDRAASMRFRQEVASENREFDESLTAANAAAAAAAVGANSSLEAEGPVDVIESRLSPVQRSALKYIENAVIITYHGRNGGSTSYIETCNYVPDASTVSKNWSSECQLSAANRAAASNHNLSSPNSSIQTVRNRLMKQRKQAFLDTVAHTVQAYYTQQSTVADASSLVYAEHPVLYSHNVRLALQAANAALANTAKPVQRSPVKQHVHYSSKEVIKLIEDSFRNAHSNTDAKKNLVFALYCASRMVFHLRNDASSTSQSTTRTCSYKNVLNGQNQDGTSYAVAMISTVAPKYYFVRDLQNDTLVPKRARQYTRAKRYNLHRKAISSYVIEKNSLIRRISSMTFTSPCQNLTKNITTDSNAVHERQLPPLLSTAKKIVSVLEKINAVVNVTNTNSSNKLQNKHILPKKTVFAKITDAVAPTLSTMNINTSNSDNNDAKTEVPSVSACVSPSTTTKSEPAEDLHQQQLPNTYASCGLPRTVHVLEKPIFQSAILAQMDTPAPAVAPPAPAVKDETTTETTEVTMQDITSTGMSDAPLAIITEPSTVSPMTAEQEDALVSPGSNADVSNSSSSSSNDSSDSSKDTMVDDEEDPVDVTDIASKQLDTEVAFRYHIDRPRDALMELPIHHPLHTDNLQFSRQSTFAPSVNFSYVEQLQPQRQSHHSRVAAVKDTFLCLTRQGLLYDTHVQQPLPPLGLGEDTLNLQEESFESRLHPIPGAGDSIQVNNKSKHFGRTGNNGDGSRIPYSIAQRVDTDEGHGLFTGVHTIARMLPRTLVSPENRLLQQEQHVMLSYAHPRELPFVTEHAVGSEEARKSRKGRGLMTCCEQTFSLRIPAWLRNKLVISRRSVNANRWMSYYEPSLNISEFTACNSLVCSDEAVGEPQSTIVNVNKTSHWSRRGITLSAISANAVSNPPHTFQLTLHNGSAIEPSLNAGIITHNTTIHETHVPKMQPLESAILRYAQLSSMFIRSVSHNLSFKTSLIDTTQLDTLKYGKPLNSHEAKKLYERLLTQHVGKLDLSEHTIMELSSKNACYNRSSTMPYVDFVHLLPYTPKNNADKDKNTLPAVLKEAEEVLRVGFDNTFYFTTESLHTLLSAVLEQEPVVANAPTRVLKTSVYYNKSVDEDYKADDSLEIELKQAIHQRAREVVHDKRPHYYKPFLAPRVALPLTSLDLDIVEDRLSRATRDLLIYEQHVKVNVEGKRAVDTKEEVVGARTNSQYPVHSSLQLNKPSYYVPKWLAAPPAALVLRKAVYGAWTRKFILKSGFLGLPKVENLVPTTYIMPKPPMDINDEIIRHCDSLWRVEEDRILLHYVNTFGSNWNLVSDALNLHPIAKLRLKTGRQCLIRYFILKHKEATHSSGYQTHDAFNMYYFTSPAHLASSSVYKSQLSIIGSIKEAVAHFGQIWPNSEDSAKKLLACGSAALRKQAGGATVTLGNESGGSSTDYYGSNLSDNNGDRKRKRKADEVQELLRTQPPVCEVPTALRLHPDSNIVPFVYPVIERGMRAASAHKENALGSCRVIQTKDGTQVRHKSIHTDKHKDLIVKSILMQMDPSQMAASHQVVVTSSNGNGGSTKSVMSPIELVKRHAQQNIQKSVRTLQLAKSIAETEAKAPPTRALALTTHGIISQNLPSAREEVPSVDPNGIVVNNNAHVAPVASQQQQQQPGVLPQGNGATAVRGVPNPALVQQQMQMQASIPGAAQQGNRAAYGNHMYTANGNVVNTEMYGANNASTNANNSNGYYIGPDGQRYLVQGGQASQVVPPSTGQPQTQQTQAQAQQQQQLLLQQQQQQQQLLYLRQQQQQQQQQQVQQQGNRTGVVNNTNNVTAATDSNAAAAAAAAIAVSNGPGYYVPNQYFNANNNNATQQQQQQGTHVNRTASGVPGTNTAAYTATQQQAQLLMAQQQAQQTHGNSNNNSNNNTATQQQQLYSYNQHFTSQQQQQLLQQQQYLQQQQQYLQQQQQQHYAANQATVPQQQQQQ